MELHTIASTALGAGGGGVDRFWPHLWLFFFLFVLEASRGLYLFMNQFEIDRLISQSRVSQFFVPQSSLMCNPDSRSPAGFKCQRGNPAWRLFWYCWTLSWKTFLLSNQGCSGFRGIGSLVQTPHLITAEKRFEELKMFHCFCLESSSFIPKDDCRHLKQPGNNLCMCNMVFNNRR